MRSRGMLAVRRRLLSVPGLAAVLSLLAVLAVGGMSLINRWSDQQTLAQAVDSAQVVSDLAVRSHVEPDHILGITTPNLLQVFDIQQDVNRLHADRRLVGVQVWRVDGTPLFTDDGLTRTQQELSPGQARRAARGVPWVVTGSPDGAAATLDVFLPYLDSAGNGVAVAKVLLPERELTRHVRTANTIFRTCLALLLLVVSAALVSLRRRLGAREHQARHDPLTGLLNRGALLEDLRAVLRGHTPRRGTALLIIDLDGFKSINDSLGHAAGDKLLAQVAGTLTRAVRAGDLVARLGGDEFAVVLRDLPDGQDAADLAGHLLGSLRAASFAVEGVALAVDASIGIAAHPEHGHSVEELLQHADVAMYQSKSGRVGVTAYDRERDHHDVGQLAVLVELREAIRNDQLVLHYQPQVDLRSGQVIGAEALVRWQHPTRGLLFPDSFVPLAEPTGLMHPLTGWVLRTAVAQAACWRHQGMGLRVAVNISPRSLVEGDLPAMVVQALADAGLPTRCLELEITETAAMSDPERAAGILRRLRSMGVRVSIDDFGSGYSSLAYLRMLPVAAVKLDRTLVTHLLEHPEDEAVTEAVIGLSHRLGLQVLAEGVESEPVRDRLAALGCDHAQGYAISRPMAAAAFQDWFRDRRSPPPLPRQLLPARLS